MLRCSSFDHRKRESINDKNKMKVYTTVYAFQSLTQQIGGNMLTRNQSILLVLIYTHMNQHKRYD